MFTGTSVSTIQLCIAEDGSKCWSLELLLNYLKREQCKKPSANKSNGPKSSQSVGRDAKVQKKEREVSASIFGRAS